MLEPTHETHRLFLRQALSLARLSLPKPTNFRVGCVIVSYPTASDPVVLSTGYTLELPGNTHAEQNALSKLASQHNIPESRLNDILTPDLNATLYTTLEPCGLRLSGNLPCVERIIATRKDDADGGIRKVIFGAKEPGTFVQDSASLKRLDEAGVRWEYVGGLDDEILQVAMEGHMNKGVDEGKESMVGAQREPLHQQPHGATNVDDISPEERARQEQLPRNPKKRMMEVDVPP